MTRLGRTRRHQGHAHAARAGSPHREQFVERFRREANSAAAIANPHIVQVYDTGEFNGLDYLVMEYVHGVNLRHDMNAAGHVQRARDAARRSPRRWTDWQRRTASASSTATSSPRTS